MSKKGSPSKNQGFNVSLINQKSMDSNNNLEQKFQIAFKYQQAQNFSEAERVYREIIEVNPNYIKALGELGNVLQQQGKFQDSQECYQKIIKISPDNYLSYSNLGLALIKQGLMTEAIKVLRQSIKLNPNYFQSYYLLAGALTEEKQYQEAIETLRQVIKLKPDHFEAYYNLGCALQTQGKYAEASDIFRQVIKLNPNFYLVYNSLGFNLEKQGLYKEAQATFDEAIKFKPDFALAYNNLGLVLAKQQLLSESRDAFLQAIKYDSNYSEAYNNLALIQKDLKQYQEAISNFKQAITLQSDYVVAYSNLGNLYQELGRNEEAEEILEKAIEINPSYAITYSNLGNLLQQIDRFEDAEKVLRKAVELQQDYAQAYINLGVTLYKQRFLEEAEKLFRQGLELESGNQDAHLNLGLLLLLTQRFNEGFPEYQWRFKTNQITLPEFTKPEWKGEDLHDKSILLISEQGLGDTLQFIRYASILKQKGAIVKLCCQKQLISLCLNIDDLNQVVQLQKNINCDYDYYAPIMGLPHLLGETPDTLTTNIPYITNWQQADLKLPTLPNIKYKIGIVWASDIRNKNLYKQKSCAIEFFIKLLDIKDISLYSLQVGVDSDLINPYLDTSKVFNISPFLQDFIDTASAVSQLDLIISIDTAVAHLAGAMGKPVWNLLPYVPDWRWFLEKNDTPWYPTMRLFRQPKLDDWVSVFVEVGNSLAELVGDTQINFTPADFAQALEETKQIISVPHIFSLANKLAEDGKYKEAETNYKKVTQLKPNYADAYNNLGYCLQQQGLNKQAREAYEKAIELQPDLADVHNNLAALLTIQRQFKDAEKYCQSAIKLKPDYEGAYNNLAFIYQEQGLFQEAKQTYQQTLEINKDSAEANFSLALLLLLEGNYREGFKEYEWRFLAQKVTLPKLTKSQWQGEDIKDKTLLIISEQGFGDTIQFIRYVYLLSEKVASLKVACYPNLVKLFSQIKEINEVVSLVDINQVDYDVYIPLMSLPYLLGITSEAIPQNIPYLTISPANPIKIPLPEDTQFKVGIVWASKLGDRQDFHNKKSCGLNLFLPLLSLNGVTLYSLQVGKDSLQINQFKDAVNLVDLSDKINDFNDTASIINQLDLVISVDTAVAHLAGAIGKPVWILLPFAPDWRWLLNRSDSPWYPTMRLFRQPQSDNWVSVFVEIGNALGELVGDKKATFIEEDFAELTSSLEEMNFKELESEFNLGVKYHQENNFTEAIKIYSQITDRKYIQPTAEINNLVVKTANNLGVILTEEKRFQEAVNVLRNATKLEQNSAHLYYNLGRPLLELKELDEAEKCFRESIKLNPNSAEAYIYLGMVVKRQGLLTEAEKYYNQAIAINPNMPEVYINLGIAYNEQQKLEESNKCYLKALQIKPDLADAHANLGCNLMLIGNLQEGLTEFEWRFQTEQVKIPNISNPQWQGENLQGKIILIIPEQGLGDMIQFIRYTDILHNMGAIVKVACDKSLVDLFNTIHSINQVIPPQTVVGNNEFDYYIPIMSIPHVLGTTVNTIPTNIPYIKNIPNLELFATENTNLKVGFVWATNIKKLDMYQKKSCPIDFFINLLDIAGVTLYSLQVGEDESDIQPYLNNPNVIDLRPKINNFLDTAKIINQLDLIISVDTAVVHLAGAIGKPVWNLLPFLPDWRWLLNRNDSPWYPTMRLFRQPKIGDWESVFVEIKDALVKVINNPHELITLTNSQPIPDVIYTINLGENLNTLPLIKHQKKEIEVIESPTPVNIFYTDKAREINPEIVKVNIQNVKQFFLIVDENINKTMSRYLKQYHIWETAETNLIVSLIKPDSQIIDLSESIGYYTLLFSQLAGEKGKVYNFVSESNNYRLVMANKLINNCNNISCYHSQQEVFNDFYTTLNGSGVDFIKIENLGNEIKLLSQILPILNINKNRLACLIKFSPVMLSKTNNSINLFVQQLQQLEASIFWLKPVSNQVNLIQVSCEELTHKIQAITDIEYEDLTKEILVFFSQQAQQKYLSY